MFVLALTGSIGMGKSTTARMLAEQGCALWDADEAVHRLYAKNGAAVSPMQTLFPDAIENGAVSRQKLRDIISRDASALEKIETLIHPLVAQDRELFLKSATTDIAVLDIPLLFETGGQGIADAVVCVSIPPEEQEKRVLARGTMSAAQFYQIRDKQMPNDEKCARSDFVVVTDTVEHARAQVQTILAKIRERIANA